MTVLNLLSSFMLLLGFWGNPTIPSKTADVNVNCNATAYTDKCKEQIPERFTYLRNYPLDFAGGKNKIQYNYIFSKDNKYVIILANDSPKLEGLIITIFDSNHKQLATNFVNNKYYTTIMYECKATGNYYMTFTNSSQNATCAAAVLAFQR
jgi:hypothetical protein